MQFILKFTKKPILLLLFCPFIALFANKVDISGKIQEPLVENYNGRFEQIPITFQLDSELEYVVYTVHPSVYGNFSLEIPLEKPAPFCFEYNDEIHYLFLEPNDDLHIRFHAEQLEETLHYEGRAAVHCQIIEKLSPNVSAQNVFGRCLFA